jgi:hypothetical protein
MFVLLLFRLKITKFIEIINFFLQKTYWSLNQQVSFIANIPADLRVGENNPETVNPK